MLLPTLFSNNFIDDFMDFPFSRHERDLMPIENGVMKTDVKETKNGYEIEVDLPGFKKENINAKLQEGYLTISATKNDESEEKEGKYIRRERFTGSISRSFYVGEGLTEADIKAKFEEGILKIALPKEEPKKIETHKFIPIEG